MRKLFTYYNAIIYDLCLPVIISCAFSLQWRHNERNIVSNHQPHDCLLNRLFSCRSKKTSKLRVTGLYAGNSPVTGEFPTQMASNAENVSIWWRHPILHVTHPNSSDMIICRHNIRNNNLISFTWKTRSGFINATWWHSSLWRHSYRFMMTKFNWMNEPDQFSLCQLNI